MSEVGNSYKYIFFFVCMSKVVKILSWNVNGIRAVSKKDALWPLVEKESPDIVCLQETKISSEGDFCFAKAGDTYIILLKKGGASQLDLENHEGDYTIKWLDPRNGGDLQNGSVKTFKGSGSMPLGLAPNNPEKDWVVLVRRNR